MAGDGSPEPSPALPAATQALAEAYRLAASRRLTAIRQPDQAAGIEREHEDVYFRLRQTVEGRQAITSLLADPDDAVRIWAAVHSMEWSPAPSGAVLTEMAGQRSPFAVTAAWALRSSEAGQLLAALGVRGWDGRWLQPPPPTVP